MAEKKTLMLILDKYASWLGAHWRIIIGMSLWMAIVLIILFTGILSLSDRIQAASVITLVFITLFYAVQTQALVKEERRALEEEKKKRAADFGERKIIVLLGPLSEKLKEFIHIIFILFEETDKVRFHEYSVEARNELQLIEKFFRTNMHMASGKLRVELQCFFNDTQMILWRQAAWADDEKNAYRIEMPSELNSLIRTIELEIEKITSHIQSTYEITSQP
jgi:hypothetical protein